VASVALAAISKSYDAVPVVDNVSFDLDSGRFLTLLGPSGCGKSTTLRLIAGLVIPDGGQVLIDGSVVDSIPTHLRQIAMVFQNLALFPHMNVGQNVAFGLRMQRIERKDRLHRVQEALALVKLSGFEERLPRQLSGGQQQRVALARALITRPRVLLLDEPFAALDRKLRLEMQSELRDLTQRTGTTAIFVTHDQDEALVLSDRIAVMNAGRIEQIAEPQTIYETPATAFVADFMGATNLLVGRVTASNGGRSEVTLDAQPVTVPVCADFDVGQRVTIMLRPEVITFDEIGMANSPGITGVIDNVVYQGSCLTCRVRAGDGSLILVARKQLIGTNLSSRYSAGDRVRLSWQSNSAHVIPATL
jgi:spermidine/putrescine ABC transporter ATP-binding subunit